MQKSFFDLGRRKKHEGMELAYFNANSAWKEAAANRLVWLAHNRQTFTADDIIMHLNEQGIVTGNNSALGAVMQAGARSGLIESTDHYITSKRPSRHQGPVMVWKSRLRRRRLFHAAV